MKPRQPGPVARRDKVAIPSGSKRQPGRCGGGLARLSLPPQNPGRREDQMPAEALKCKECSTTYPLEARYVCERCFGPLEVAYRAPASTADELKRRIQAGPDTLWRYADFLPLERTWAAMASPSRVPCQTPSPGFQADTR